MGSEALRRDVAGPGIPRPVLTSGDALWKLLRDVLSEEPVCPSSDRPGHLSLQFESTRREMKITNRLLRARN